MNKEEIFAKAQLIIMDTLGLDKNEITLESHFINDLGCDSLILPELIMIVEDKFELRIPDIEAEKLRTVGNIVDYIVEKGQLIS